MEISIYCKGDRTYHYSSELPRTLQSFVCYNFSTGTVTGQDFKSFSTKYKNALKKLLPEGFSIHKWYQNHYFISAVLRNQEGQYIYLSIPDVRYWEGEWYSNILIRMMKSENDCAGGLNHYTTLFTLTDDLTKLCRD